MEISTTKSVHWLSIELLNRFAEALDAGLDARQMYSQVHAHLDRCEACRQTLGELRQAADGFLVDRMPRLSVPNLQIDVTPGKVIWAWRPDSRLPSFGLQVAIDTGGHNGSFLPLVNDAGGTWQVYEQFSLPDMDVGMLAVIEQDVPDRITVTGRLIAAELPPQIDAYLFVGIDVHQTQVYGGKARFDSVALRKGVHRIALLFEVDEDGEGNF